MHSLIQRDWCAWSPTPAAAKHHRKPSIPSSKCERQREKWDWMIAMDSQSTWVRMHPSYWANRDKIKHTHTHTNIHKHYTREDKHNWRLQWRSGIRWQWMSRRIRLPFFFFFSSSSSSVPVKILLAVSINAMLFFLSIRALHKCYAVLYTYMGTDPVYVTWTWSVPREYSWAYLLTHFLGLFRVLSM